MVLTEFYDNIFLEEAKTAIVLLVVTSYPLYINVFGRSVNGLRFG